jgi:hypothetical protein
VAKDTDVVNVLLTLVDSNSREISRYEREVFIKAWRSKK